MFRCQTRKVLSYFHGYWIPWPPWLCVCVFFRIFTNKRSFFYYFREKKLFSLTKPHLLSLTSVSPLITKQFTKKNPFPAKISDFFFLIIKFSLLFQTKKKYQRCKKPVVEDTFAVDGNEPVCTKCIWSAIDGYHQSMNFSTPAPHIFFLWQRCVCENNELMAIYLNKFYFLCLQNNWNQIKTTIVNKIKIFEKKKLSRTAPECVSFHSFAFLRCS